VGHFGNLAGQWPLRWQPFFFPAGYPNASMAVPATAVRRDRSIVTALRIVLIASIPPVHRTIPFSCPWAQNQRKNPAFWGTIEGSQVSKGSRINVNFAKVWSGRWESNRTPIEFPMISVDFTESRNSLCLLMANGLEALRDELPPSAASIILQVQSQQ
jgi:hypothetical protein